MEDFFRYVFDLSKTIGDILSRNIPMRSLSDDERHEFDLAVVCSNCGEEFSKENGKTLHHNHVSGDYLFPACNSCNLALKPRKLPRFSTGDIGRGGDNNNSYLLPIIFHNLTHTNGHFVLKFFKKEYARYTAKNGKVHYVDVGVIPVSYTHLTLPTIYSV